MPDYRHTTRSQKEVFLALTQLEHSHFYNLVDTVTITGDFDIERMRQAVRQLSAEIPTLRTNQIYHEGDIVSVLRKDDLTLEYVDFSDTPSNEDQVRQLISKSLEHDFDIQHDLLSHFIIAKQNKNQWLLIEYGSHILLDGWTHALVYNRLVDIYNNNAEDTASQFGTLDDLISCEHAYLASANYQKDRSYWLDYCAKLPAPLKLSRDDAAVGHQVRCRGHLDKALVSRLRTLAQARKLRLSSLMLTIFGIFLGKLSGQTQFTVGIPVASRLDKLTRMAPGMVSTILPFAFSVSHSATLDKISRGINHTLRRHLLHQRYHSEEMIRDIPPESRTQALFHTTLNVIAYEQKHCFEGCQVAFQNESNGYTANLAFDLFDRNPDGTLEFGITANGNLYTESMLTRYYERFVLLVERILDAPDAPVGDYSLLTDREWLTHATRAARPARQFETFNAYLARHIHTHPELIAVKDGDETLTYAQLADLSQRLAGQLAASGIRQNDLIGVMLPRSIDWAISVVALYHLGATYLPLHADLPDERLRYMLDDAHARGVIARDEARFHAIAPELDLITFNRSALAHATRVEAATLTPDTGAYVIYTSGSTGLPKGVLVPHEGIVDEFNAMQRACGIQPGDRMLQCSAMSFDVSCLELTLALLSGAGLVITDHSVLTGDSTRLAAFLEHHDVTHLFMTPAVLGCHTAQALPAHVTMFLTGEATPKALLERFAHCKQLINLYGPSEATVITINPHFSPSDMSLGTVIDTMHVYVLDEQRRLMPPGSCGELYVAGTGLAVGYINKPEMTRERFVPDIFRAHQRMYATGDRVYQDEAGRLFYLGRKDNQVKLRGQRIELGEIRNALLACPGVEEAHVLIEERETLGQVLVAYIRTPSPLSKETLKQKLRRTLPLYMVPNVIHTLRILPLTPNGKLDIRQLRQHIEEDTPNTEQDNAPEANAAEAMVCNIFASVLKTPAPVRPDQDFFMLGGHSLLAFKVIQQVQDAFDIELGVADLMANPTPRGVVAQLFNHQKYDALMPVLKLRPGQPERPHVWCMNIGSGLGWPYGGLLKYFPVDWPVYALQSVSLKDKTYAPKSIDEVATDHIARIQSIQPQGPYHLVGWSFGGQLAHTVATQLQQQGECVDSLVIIDSYPTSATSLLNYRLSKQDPGTERLVRAILNEDVSHLTDWDAAINARFGVENGPHGSLLDTIVEELNTSMALMDTYCPQHYDGDVFFVQGKEEDELRDASQIPEAWAPHISGQIHVHKVDFLHETLMHTEALECYAPLLTQHLSARMR